MAEQLRLLAIEFPEGILGKFFTCIVQDNQGNAMQFYMRPRLCQTPLDKNCMPINAGLTLQEMDFAAHSLMNRHFASRA